MLSNKEFVHLHTHTDKGSNIRLLDSINKVKDMVDYVDSIGGDALAITDHESLSSHIDFLKYTKNFNKKHNKNFKAILGNEIYLLDEDDMNSKIENKESVTFYHFLLIAKDTKGHEQLRRLSSRAWRRMFNFRKMDRVPTFYSDFEDIVSSEKGHLIGSTACLGGYFPKQVLKLLDENIDEKEKEDIRDNIHNFITWGLDTFGEDDFFIEIQPSLMQDQIEFNKKAIKIAEAYNIKYIITTDAHYLKKEDREIHEAYLTSNDDDSGSREVGDFYSSTHFFTVEELYSSLNYIDKEKIETAILNTKKIKEKIEEYDLFKNPKIPLTPIEDKANWFKNKTILNKALKYNYISKMINDKKNEYNVFLIATALKGVEEKINKDEYDAALERIDIECKEIIGISKAKEQPVAGYFTTMKKNIDIIWEEAESIVPPGRGSAGAYIINYLIGITQVNPLKQGIEMPHFRFISAERPDYPDIDIDIPSHKRNIVFEKVRNYYQSIGGDMVRVCTFGTETAKSAIQTACRGLKINSDVAMYLSSLIPIERGNVRDIKTCYYGDKEKGILPVTEFKNLVDELSDKVGKNLLKVALGIEGLVNKRSSHACGIIISNEKFTNRNALMRTPSGELVTQFDLHDSEELGGIKYDLE